MITHSPWGAARTLALLMLCVVPLRAQGEISLRVGDKAPNLTHVEWLRGDAVPSYQEGHTYVLDFWATWCGPCVQSIPHVNELATSHAEDGLTVIGVAIWPNPSMKPTRAFVEEQGDAMSYTLASDLDGQTATAYMQAAGQDGIPTAMIVDGSGHLAWIGNPLSDHVEMKGVVEQVLAGTYDVTAAREQAAAWQAALHRARPLDMALSEALNEGNWPAVLEHAQALAALHVRFIDMHSLSYLALLRIDDSGRRAEQLGRRLISNELKDNAQQLELFAWRIVAPNSGIPDGMRDVELALVAAQRADALTQHKNASIQDTLARSHFQQGDIPAAIALQSKAIALTQADEELVNKLPVLTQYESTLAEYQAVLDLQESREKLGSSDG